MSVSTSLYVGVVEAEESVQAHVSSASSCVPLLHSDNPPRGFCWCASDRSAMLSWLFVDLRNAAEKTAFPVLTILDNSHE